MACAGLSEAELNAEGARVGVSVCTCAVFLRRLVAHNVYSV